MKTKPITFLLTALILSFTCLAGSSFGFDEDDLKKTKSGKVCVKRDLSNADFFMRNLTGANLSLTTLTLANLEGANSGTGLLGCRPPVPEIIQISNTVMTYEN